MIQFLAHYDISWKMFANSSGKQGLVFTYGNDIIYQTKTTKSEILYFGIWILE
jgi:hypothetical protein